MTRINTIELSDLEAAQLLLAISVAEKNKAEVAKLAPGFSRDLDKIALKLAKAINA
ncbi:hypothetical protein ACFUPZ_00115 [Microbacterium oxydans]|uniref:hypothetical protein n=1 Tax=Microbacterium oxydans TaxID=82380 RepID=UPI00362F30ED